MSQHLSRRHFSLGLAGLGATALAGSVRAEVPHEGEGESKTLCFVGGYTQHGPPGISGNGEGIAVFEMERDTGVLTLITTFMDIPSPSFITLTKDRKFLYALSEINDYNAEGDGCITAFAVDTHTGTLAKINTVSSGGAVPAHLSIHPSGKYVLVANYVGGCVSVIPIRHDGSLGEATDVVHNTGPRQPERAEDNPQGNFAVSDHSGSHPHMIGTDPSGRFVLADDAGLDRVYVWTLDEKHGKLIPAKKAYYNMTPGSAPRHFVFDHSGRMLYNLCEQNSKVVVSKFDPKTGEITFIQSVSTVTSHFRGSTLAAEILISESGKYIYVSNRLGDSLAVFAVGQDGTLILEDEVWMHADYGRAMMFDPSGNFLFCANQRSDVVTTFRVDRDTGKPRFVHKFTPVGSPTTFAFMVTDA
ncbi:MULTISPECIES: lactonase family protein [unclassified Saccharibacter]|uniref:lactonase family protein n=1 Tax=unclassified Saccharibacter TaxID=2648722 RepID=UPI001323A4B8|nr:MULTISPECIES: lactonase family protein [unclassified Saccharibacter]MXV35408.1 beta-propeller fold lactonase family protein [Saccharibacter sp. EH611]MXV58068.1 beta-propeller fold lactonase family protein [Saccharibacter sp. EH70]MXV65342.1 beta-propeller fold lactonase family protein [Saccharibacter sp. EH60]